jgi:hypothetical protein
MGWLFWNAMAHPLQDGENSISPPHWHWPHCISPFGKSVEDSNTGRSHLSLNDNPSLCASFYSAGVVGKIYQWRWSRLVYTPHKRSGITHIDFGSGLLRCVLQNMPGWAECSSA